MLQRKLTAKQAIRVFEVSFNMKMSEALKDLLENKHLYQRVTLDEKRQAATASSNMVSEPAEVAAYVRGIQSVRVNPITLTTTTESVTDNVHVGNLKLFCTRCDRREAFAPLFIGDIGSFMPETPFSSVQQFVFVFQCQSCKSLPQTFLVHRANATMILMGRSPMENIELPPYIPKAEKDFYRDAVIAYNAGKPLAAVFYFRTFLEQFGRRVTGISERTTGDEIMSRYAETIPLKLRDSMPSLAEWYDSLSAAIHSAKVKETLFEDSKKAIDKHFEIRKVFDIPESAARPAETSK